MHTKGLMKFSSNSDYIERNVPDKLVLILSKLLQLESPKENSESNTKWIQVHCFNCCVLTLGMALFRIEFSTKQVESQNGILINFSFTRSSNESTFKFSTASNFSCINSLNQLNWWISKEFQIKTWIQLLFMETKCIMLDGRPSVKA